MQRLSGTVALVATRHAGSALAAPASAGDTFLLIQSQLDFLEGDSLSIGEEVLPYSLPDLRLPSAPDGDPIPAEISDPDFPELRAESGDTPSEDPIVPGDPIVPEDLGVRRVDLGAPIAADYPEGYPVLCAPPRRVRFATVSLGSGGDPISATVPFALADRLPEGIYNGESRPVVTILNRSGLWAVEDVYQVDPVVDGSYIDPATLPVPSELDERLAKAETDLSDSNVRVGTAMERLDGWTAPDGVSIDGSSIAAKTITAESGALADAAIGSAQIRDLDVAKLIASDATLATAVVNKLFAEVIQARKISAEELGIGVLTTSYLPDPGFESATPLAGWTTNGAVEVVGSGSYVPPDGQGDLNYPGTYSGSKYLRIPPGASASYTLDVAGTNWSSRTLRFACLAMIDSTAPASTTVDPTTVIKFTTNVKDSSGATLKAPADNRLRSSIRNWWGPAYTSVVFGGVPASGTITVTVTAPSNQNLFLDAVVFGPGSGSSLELDDGLLRILSPDGSTALLATTSGLQTTSLTADSAKISGSAEAWKFSTTSGSTGSLVMGDLDSAWVGVRAWAADSSPASEIRFLPNKVQTPNVFSALRVDVGARGSLVSDATYMYFQDRLTDDGTLRNLMRGRHSDGKVEFPQGAEVAGQPVVGYTPTAYVVATFPAGWKNYDAAAWGSWTLRKIGPYTASSTGVLSPTAALAANNSAVTATGLIPAGVRPVATQLQIVTGSQGARALIYLQADGSIKIYAFTAVASGEYFPVNFPYNL